MQPSGGLIGGAELRQLRPSASHPAIAGSRGSLLLPSLPVPRDPYWAGGRDGRCCRQRRYRVATRAL
eukprot:3194712-Prymnesium_polylepis.1